MKVIYKYRVTENSNNLITVPKGAVPLRVDVQGSMIYLWAEVDTDAPEGTIHIAIYGTGDPMPSHGLTYINTFFLIGGALVFHAYVVG